MKRTNQFGFTLLKGNEGLRNEIDRVAGSAERELIGSQ